WSSATCAVSASGRSSCASSRDGSKAVSVANRSAMAANSSARSVPASAAARRSASATGDVRVIGDPEAERAAGPGTGVVDTDPRSAAVLRHRSGPGLEANRSGQQVAAVEAAVDPEGLPDVPGTRGQANVGRARAASDARQLTPLVDL